MAIVLRIFWVRFAFALRKAWVDAAEGAVGRKRREGRVRVERVYETPYRVLVRVIGVRGEWTYG
jgi:hypothetical protein